MKSRETTTSDTPQRGRPVRFATWRGIRDQIRSAAGRSAVPIDATAPRGVAIQRGTVTAVDLDWVSTDFGAIVAKPQALRGDVSNYVIGQPILAGAFPQRGTGVIEVEWIDLNVGAVR